MRAPRSFFYNATLPILVGGVALLSHGDGKAVQQKPIFSVKDRGAVVEVEFHPPASNWAFDENGEADVLVEGFGSMRTKGRPAVPARVWQVALPRAGASWSWELKTAEYREFRGPRLRPSPEWESGADGESRPVRNPDRVFYERGGFHPESPVRVREGGVSRHVPFLDVEVTPVMVRPRDGRIRHYTRLVVVIRMEADAEVQAESSTRLQSLSDRFFGTNHEGFLNPNQASAVRERESRRGRAIAPVKPSGKRALREPSFYDGGAVVPASFETEADSYKISVSKTGLYQLSYEYLDANTDLPVASLDPRKLRLFNKGVEIPIYVSGESDGVFSPGEYVEFYGEKYVAPYQADRWMGGDYTDTNVYWLTLGSENGLRAATRNASPVNGFTTRPSFTSVVHYEENAAIPPGSPMPTDPAEPVGTFVLRTQAGRDHWFWDQLATPPSSTGQPAEWSDLPLVIPDATGTGSASAEFEVFGVTSSSAHDPDHRFLARLNGTTIADVTWDGRVFHNFSVSVPPSLLALNSTLYIEAPTLAPANTVAFNWVRLTYERYFKAYQNRLPFSYGAGNHRFVVANFGNPDIAAYDVSSPTAPVRLVNFSVAVAGGGTYTATMEESIPASATRTYYAASSFEVPDAIVKNTPSDLKNTGNGADWILITSDEFFNDAKTQALVNHRAGQGLRAMKVRVQDIYDEFNHGVADPQAIKDFLSHAYFFWQPPSPAFVLFVGEASTDSKNNYGRSPFHNHVPTFTQDADTGAGFYASDMWFGLVDGTDYHPDIHVGRFSVRDGADLAVLVNRVLDYETSPPPGAWKGHAVLISDEKKKIEESIFETTHNDAAAKILSPATHQKIYYCQAPWYGCNIARVACSNGACTNNANAVDCNPSNLCPTANIRNDIAAAINAGAAVVSYVGHGNGHLWSGDVIFSKEDEDTDLLMNGGKTPFLVNAGCSTAAFSHPGNPEAFMEKLTRLSGRGFVATYGESSVAEAGDGYISITSLFEQIYGRHKHRNIGLVTTLQRSTLVSVLRIESAMAYTLIGDPATRLVIPAPAPTANLWVSGVGDRRVDLAWNASTDTSVAGYHIYRKRDVDASFTRITSTPVAGTTYTDGPGTGLVNTTTYQYYTTAVNADGFEGASSMEVQAVPLNPDPPAVPDLTGVFDPQLGMRLRVTWNANTEPDFSHYTVHYGTSPGPPYASSVNAYMPAVEHVIGGLSDDVLYYVAMTATNTSGKTSGYSTELTGTPTHGIGFAPPEMVDVILDVSASGKPVLRWTAPATNIYGGAVALSKFSVYRSGKANFVPQRTVGANPDRIAEVAFQAGVSEYAYEDADPAAPADAYYYVTAWSTQNAESSVGRPHPQPAYNVIYEDWDGEGYVYWSHPSPLLDVKGGLTERLRYHVYASTNPAFQPDRYNKSNNPVYYNAGNQTWAYCCDGCEINFADDCSTLHFRVVIEDVKGNEGLH